MSTISFDAQWKLKNFLLQVWSYESPHAQCFTIVAIGQGTEFKHFCLDEHGSLGKLVNAVAEYVANNYSRWLDSKMHVYFQVLPLAEKPPRGRGTAQHVKVGRWLFLDLDYKRTTKEKPAYIGCSEGDDHALECYYQEGNNFRHVKRPPLDRVLDNIEKQLGSKPTIIVDSGNGYHVYFKLNREVEAQELAKLLELLVDTIGGDPQAKDLARILRLPGTVNPRVGRICDVIYTSNFEFDPEELRKRLESLPRGQGQKGQEQKQGGQEEQREVQEGKESRGFKELKDNDIIKIASLLEQAYIPGYRQTLLLYLAGWLARANVHPLSAVKLVKYLYDKMQDTDPLKTRLAAMVYTYKKAGINIDEYANEIRAITGVKPYGLEREIKEAEIRGKTGLQEVLEELLGEEKALAIIHELSEILKSYSPYGDSIIVVLNRGKQLYAVANMRTLILARARREENKLVYREIVANVCPVEVIVYTNPLGGIRKYQVTFAGKTLDKPLIIGPAYLDEIIDRLKREGFVRHRMLVDDVLSSIVQGFEERGRAVKKAEIESPGFYVVDGKLVTVKYDVETPVDSGRLKEALLLLNELAELWFGRTEETKSKFATVVKWGVLAPFSYVLKTGRIGTRRVLKWLFLYGEPATGKSTLGRIVLKIWGLGADHEKTGSHFNTEARFGRNVSFTTFPVLVHEPGAMFKPERGEIVEMIKQAVDGENIRGKYLQGTYIEYPSLASLVFASNSILPNDPGLLRRIMVIQFSASEIVPQEKQDEFNVKVEPRLPVLAELGKCIAKQVFNDVKVLDKADLLKAGEELLRGCYRLADLEVPSWLELVYKEEDMTEHYNVVEEFRARFINAINDAYARYVSRLVEVEVERDSRRYYNPDELSIEKKLEVLLAKRGLAGVEVHEKKTGERVVIFTRSFFRDTLKLNIIMKSLAERFGWQYTVVKIAGHPTKVIEAPYEKVFEFISSSSIKQE